jgi:hypothetical protein
MDSVLVPAMGGSILTVLQAAACYRSSLGGEWKRSDVNSVSILHYLQFFDPLAVVMDHLLSYEIQTFLIYVRQPTPESSRSYDKYGLLPHTHALLGSCASLPTSSNVY